jgi:hypothetical protein
VTRNPPNRSSATQQIQVVAFCRLEGSIFRTRKISRAPIDLIDKKGSQLRVVLYNNFYRPVHAPETFGEQKERWLGANGKILDLGGKMTGDSVDDHFIFDCDTIF